MRHWSVINEATPKRQNHPKAVSPNNGTGKFMNPHLVVLRIMEVHIIA